MCVSVGNWTANAQSMIIKKDKSFNFHSSHQKLVSLKTVVHISFQIEGVFAKYLEPMLVMIPK